MWYYVIKEYREFKLYNSFNMYWLYNMLQMLIREWLGYVRAWRRYLVDISS